MKHLSRTLLLLTLLSGLWNCTPPIEPTPTPTAISATATPTVTPAPPTLTPTPLGCLNQPGRIDQGAVQETVPPQEYLIYLPPCYDEMPEIRYPVLYLLHGQTYNDDQWIRIGAVATADRLILSGEAEPFIIVFPDDRYWNSPAGSSFGQRLIEYLIPFIDENYRTIEDRNYRTLGGMSRGAGWTLRLGLQRWELFGSLGLHSMAIFGADRPFLEDLLDPIPPESWPNIFMDVGESDSEMGFNAMFEEMLTQYGIPHEWHLYPGAHDEIYWQAHIEEYLRWYTGIWMQLETE